MTKPTRKEVEAKLIAKCWKDPSFKALLKKDPKKAFKELGLLYQKEGTFEIVEEQSNQWIFVLPSSPAGVEELSASELELMAAASADPCLSHFFRPNTKCIS